MVNSSKMIERLFSTRTDLRVPVILFILLMSGCSSIRGQQLSTYGPAGKMTVPAIDTLLDSLQLKGCVLVFDSEENIYYSNDFEQADKARIPASTFKIPHSIIALELQIIKDDAHILLWDGKKRYLKTWEQDLSFREAFQLSCVPCFQEIARKIGYPVMKEYTDKLGFGHISVDSSTIDNFWLEGKSCISPMEQIDFLKRLYFGLLPISERTQEMVKGIMKTSHTDEYSLYAKTGWGVRDSDHTGWYVGFIEESRKVYFFATMVSPSENLRMEDFGHLRIMASIRALKILNLRITEP